MQHLVRVDDGLRVAIVHKLNQCGVNGIALALERVSNPVAGFALVFRQAAGVAARALLKRR